MKHKFSFPVKTDSQKLQMIAAAWMREGFQNGNAEIVEELYDENFVDCSVIGMNTDKNKLKEWISALHKAFPDFLASVQEYGADPASNMVSIKWSAHGTHKETYMNIPPQGSRIYFKGIEIIKIKNNKIIKRWAGWNSIEIQRQLRRLI